MSFVKKITKEEIQNLPLFSYSGIIEVVDSKDQFNDAFHIMSKETIIGIDSETKPTFKKGQYHHTALVQLATNDRVFLIKPQKTGMPDHLVELLENKEIMKVGIAISQDLTDLRKFKPFREQSMFDLNNICTKLGFENIGAKNLSAIFLGHRISKSQQTSNWENDPLTPAQMLYAATDAWICREIMLKLKEHNYKF
ncbi:MAG: 3'-5' exonuclease [Flavobacteriales bacterium]